MRIGMLNEKEVLNYSSRPEVEDGLSICTQMLAKVLIGLYEIQQSALESPMSVAASMGTEAKLKYPW